MKHILLNPDHVSDAEAKTYIVREAARAVVVDQDGKIALLRVEKHNYYKLPGGGIEGDEDPLTALRRECIEEIGCMIEVTAELAVITEYRKFLRIKQISYCYLANVSGEKGIATFTEEEVEEGFHTVWVPYEEALSMVGTSSASNEEGKKYIVPRDHLILLEAQR